MDQQQLEKTLAAYKASEADYPFGPDVLVYKVMSKMFALIGVRDQALQINLKCDPVDNDFLCDDFKSIRPGYHMNKRHWITVTLDGDVDDDFLNDLIAKSYRLVCEKLTQKQQKELGMRFND